VKIFGYEEINTHKIISCFIFDDCDYYCEKIDKNLLRLDVTYKAEIETKLNYRVENKRIIQNNTFTADLHFPIFLILYEGY
jgi:hypothetical protein